MTQEKITRNKADGEMEAKSGVYGVGEGMARKRRVKKKEHRRLKQSFKGLLSLFEKFKNIFSKQHCFSLGFVLFGLPFYTVVCSLFCILVLQGEFCLTRHQENCQLCQSAVITRARDQKKNSISQRGRKKKKRDRDGVWECVVGWGQRELAVLGKYILPISPKSLQLYFIFFSQFCGK